MRIEPILNKPALYSPIPSDVIDVMAMRDGYRYKDIYSRTLISNAKTKMYRYAKNYICDDLDYSLIIATHESDTNKIETYLDSVAKDVTHEQVEHFNDNGSFKYLETLYKETN